MIRRGKREDKYQGREEGTYKAQVNLREDPEHQTSIR